MNAGVVLAAGGSSRFGRPKQLVRVQGETLVHRAARAALEGGCDPVAVVVGASAGPVGAAVADLPVVVVPHEGWRDGMAGSIAAGLAGVASARPDGVVLLVCDQVRLEAAVVARVVAVAERSPAAVVACRYAGVIGVPARFPSAEVDALGRLEGDVGARELLRGREDVVVIDWPGGALDLDRPEDPGGAVPGSSI